MSVIVAPVGLDFRVYYTPPSDKKGTVMVCHHGAGYSGLSFACFSKEVTRLSGGECGVLSFDARGHGSKYLQLAIFDSYSYTSTGKTKPLDSTNEKDMSVDVLADDLTNLLKTVFPDPSEAPSFLVCILSSTGFVWSVTRLVCRT